MSGLYFEDFHEGQIFNHDWTRTVTEADNVLFCTMTMNPQPLHLDAHYAATTEFRRPIVNSIFTLGLMIGMTVNDTTLGTTLGNLGMTDIRFPNPVFHGDTLRSRTTILHVRASQSRPQQGIVEFKHEAFNQDGRLVAECRRSALMKRRPQ